MDLPADHPSTPSPPPIQGAYTYSSVGVTYLITFWTNNRQCLFSKPKKKGIRELLLLGI